MRTIVFHLTKRQRPIIIGACRNFGCQTKDLIYALLDHADSAPLPVASPKEREYFLAIPIDEAHLRILNGLCLKYHVDAHTILAALVEQQLC